MDKKRPESWKEFFLSEEKVNPDFLKDRKQPNIEVFDTIDDEQKKPFRENGNITIFPKCQPDKRSFLTRSIFKGLFRTSTHHLADLAILPNLLRTADKIN